MAQDPLRQIMSMAEDARKQFDSMIGQGTRTMRSALPELPIPGATGNSKLPAGPTEILAKLPKLPSLPRVEAKPATRAAPRPPARPLATREGYKLRNATHPTGFRLRR